jgi:pimeloyl-CoA synthetase
MQAIELQGNAKYGTLKNSIERTGKKLSEGQVYLVFNKIVTRNNYLLNEGRLAEGPMDWLKTKAKNLTTKVTADKLNSAWQKAGSPTDSEQLKKFLTDQGVATEVVDKVYTDMKLPAAGAAAGAEKPVDTAELEKQINTFDTKQKQDILAYLTQSLRTA